MTQDERLAALVADWRKLCKACGHSAHAPDGCIATFCGEDVPSGLAYCGCECGEEVPEVKMCGSEQRRSNADELAAVLAAQDHRPKCAHCGWEYANGIEVERHRCEGGR